MTDPLAGMLRERIAPFRPGEVVRGVMAIPLADGGHHLFLEWTGADGDAWAMTGVLPGHLFGTTTGAFEYYVWAVIPTTRNVFLVLGTPMPSLLVEIEGARRITVTSAEA